MIDSLHHHIASNPSHLNSITTATFPDDAALTNENKQLKEIINMLTAQIAQGKTLSPVRESRSSIDRSKRSHFRNEDHLQAPETFGVVKSHL